MACHCLKVQETSFEKIGHRNSNAEVALRSLPRIKADRLGRVLVEVEKQDCNQLGLTVAGGTDRLEIPIISFIRPASIADRSDCLLVNDHIIAVNGISTAMLKHDEISSLVKNAEKKLLLEIEYELPDFPMVNSSRTMSKRIEVILEKDGNSYGFTLRGGCCRDYPTRSRPLTVMHVRPGSSADRDGRIKVGDRVLAINGINMASISCEEALTILRLSEFETVMLVEYDVAVVDMKMNERRALIIEIDKQPNETLGITLAPVTTESRETLNIDNIREASLADRCGALHVGDQILAIDGTPVSHLTVQEASQLLRNNVTTSVKLDLIPSLRRNHHPNSSASLQRNASNSMASMASSKNATRRFIHPNASSIDSTSEIPSGAFELMMNLDSSPRSLSRQGPDAHELSRKTWCTNSLNKSEGPRFSSFSSHQGTSIMNVSSTSSAHCVGAGHNHRVEVTAVILQADDRGTFGFTFQGMERPTEILLSPPIIDYIEPGGPAHRAGVLQEGDRVLSINQQPVFNRSMDSINSQLLTAASSTQPISDSFSTAIMGNPSCCLEVEFDVSDGVVPSSGIFTVKLVKKSGTLGITLNSSYHPLLISGITIGSVAYRSGTLQPGDRLLAINKQDITRCSLEEAAALLQDSNSNVVSIKVLKGEMPPGIQPSESCPKLIHNNDSTLQEVINNMLPFAVELTRTQSRTPLGLCIVESDNGQVVLGKPSAGSPAALCGQLAAGDILLAVNGHQVHGQGVESVLRQLSQAGNRVHLIVARANSSIANEEDIACSGGGGSSSGTGTDNGVGSHSNSDCSTTNTTIGNSEMRKVIFGGPARQGGMHSSLRMGIHNKIPSKDSAVDMEPGTTESESDSASPLLTSRPVRITSFDPRVRVIDEECPGCREALAAENERHHAAQARAQAAAAAAAAEVVATLSNNSQHYSSNEYQSSALRLRQSRSESQIRDNGGASPISNTSSGGSGSQNCNSTTLHHITLYKNNKSDNYGLAVASGRSNCGQSSDTLSGNGVYVSDLRPDGPAARSGQIRNRDRILQVDGVDTQHATCAQVVSLIANAGCSLTLVLGRRQVASGSSSSGTGGFPLEQTTASVSPPCTNAQDCRDNTIKKFFNK